MASDVASREFLVPAATPLPGRPAALVLGSAEVLLAGEGCAVCSYTAEANSRYMSWFALEAHADPVTFSHLLASLGMCPRHTRALIHQPGAARRLTPVYWHLMRAVPDRLGPRQPPPASCPACIHDQAAAGRAVDMVTDWLAGDEQDGTAEAALSRLCLPHVRVIAATAGPRTSRRLPQVSASHTAAAPASIEELAGGPDHDAAERARLRAALPLAADPPAWTCRVCLTGARAEATSLIAAAGPVAANSPAGGAGEYLCPQHLRDAVTIHHPGCASRLLAMQHARQSEELHRLATRARWRDHRGRGRRGARHAPSNCPTCQACDHAMQQELERHRTLLSGTVPDPADAQRLCAHHVLSVQGSGQLAGRIAAAQARSLTAELAEAFGKNTWVRRHEPKGPETTAWLRAAIFLDGRAFGGGPPSDPPGAHTGPRGQAQ
jgi:rubrerythrin